MEEMHKTQESRRTSEDGVDWDDDNDDDRLKFAGRWRDSHHGSREFVRWGSEDLRGPWVIVNGAVTVIFGEVRSGVCAVSCREERAREEESGFRPSRYGEATRKYYARGGRATKGFFSQRDWRGGHGSEQGRQHDVTVQTPVHEFNDSGSKATPRKRLVKKSGDRERTPDFGIEDEEPAFMRDEFASEPPSSRSGRVEGRWSYGIRLRGGFEDDQEGVRTMDDDNFIDDAGVDRWPCTASDNEGFIGDAPQLEKGSLAEGAKEKWLASEVDTLERSLKQAYATITNSRGDFACFAIQTESRHGNKKESDIDGKAKDFVRGS
ncbi:hypothetical protein Syun_012733 [Stephania yunnanensis]|uniref:Uncharacterized protein n=1 Tax=Stephania yunnanensis TaxID=152371 RepID=A0AAP0PFM4_9MAGN